jgi:hypothetical protein
VSGLLIAVALLAALAFTGWRAFAARRSAKRHAHALEQQPGMSPDNPLTIASFTEMDEAVDTFRCPCGGLLDRIGEGSRPGLRVVRCACVICEEDVDLFFDLSQLRH